MPIASICLECSRLYTADTTPTLGRCAPCRAKYTSRRNATKTRTPHRNTPKRQLEQKFYASRAWRTARRTALTRDLHQCTQCGTSDRLTVHHIESISTHPDIALDVDNLTTLCRSCHGTVSNTQRNTTPRPRNL